MTGRFGFCAALAAAVLVAGAADVKPSAKMLEWADCEIGVIIHQDVQVYAPDYDGEARKACRTPPASVFAPTFLDTDQWLEAAKAAGAKYAVLVVKHCSGFCLWPTKLHGYSIAASPWKGGKGDIAADFIASCREYGIRPGFYYSVGGNEHFGVDSATQKDEKRWNEYLAMVKGQLTEIWTNYGPLFEVWFDGGNLPPEKGGREIEDLLVKLQPQAVVFQGNPARSDCVRWVGNERAHAPEICWNRTDAGTGSDGMEERSGELYSGRFDGKYWVPGEADTPNRDAQHSFQGGWMWRAGQDGLVFPAEVLLDRYFTSVGRGCNMLIGMEIDDKGMVPAADFEQFSRFGKLVKALYSNKVASASGKGMCFFLDVPEGKRPDLLSVSEDLTDGENIRSYCLSGFDGKDWHQIVNGNNVGHRHLDRFRAGAYTRFRFDCWDARAGKIPVLREIALYETPDECRK